MQLAKIIITDFRANSVKHNMPCCICLIEHAVYFLDGRYFEPCWGCQRQGWKVVLKQKKWWELV